MGVTQGNSSAHSVQRDGQVLFLKNDTQYVFKISALGSSTKFTFKVYLTSV